MGEKKTSIKSIGEFDLIAKYFMPLANDCDGAFSLLDDGAVLDIPEDESIVVTTDCLVEGVHFLHSISPEHVATRALGANLSDLAAMGATPRWIFLSLQLPESKNEQWVSGFAKSLGKMMGRFGVSLAGGDTVSTVGAMGVTITAIGSIKKGSALRRSGAKPGDEIWVSGTLGDADLGLGFLKKNHLNADLSDTESINHLINRHLCPEPRVALGKSLCENAISTACIDISDGLLADLGHICAVSNVSATINLCDVPLSLAAKKLFAGNIDNAQMSALGGGDDYELLFCSGPENSSKIAALGKSIPLSKIGVISEKSLDNTPAVKVVGQDGRLIEVNHHGWEHLK